ncbi:FAD-binding dehydrogenase [Nocardioides sp. SYSU D00038]|uniref:FAD-binding dehydrogenase n=1 Tax=Nocardioides sp. SYSU D00038 TaxID=2812554 RepID=UPI0019688A90|nr:FAD-binding dehydrogenase [Nocardioides sp. SYSU D00038]
MPQLTRRTANQAAALGAAGVAVPGFLSTAAAAVTSADWRDSGTTADVIVVGHGLAGLVAANEIAAMGKKVLLLDQEGEQSLGGQAFWSLGGLFFVDSVEQRLNLIKDSIELARQDWYGTAQFSRGVTSPLGEDYWAAKWAEAYLEFAHHEKRHWLQSLGMRWVPLVGWAERGGQLAHGPGNSVPRFHLTLGTGPGVVEPFEKRVRQHHAAGRIGFRFRHRVDGLVVEGGRVVGVQGKRLVPTTAPRGVKTSREVVGDFELRAEHVLVTSGGIGGNQDLVRQNWPDRLGTAPEHMVTGVPAHVDGRMIAITEQAGGRVVNADRMWHYVEGMRNWSPIWPEHGIRIIPGPSSFWFDGNGNRFPTPGIPGYDSLAQLRMIRQSGFDYSWFVLNQKIIEKEFVLSGSEQNRHLTNKNMVAFLAERQINGIQAEVKAFLDNGEDFVVADTVEDLARGMNDLVGSQRIDAQRLREQIEARDREIANSFTKDVQIQGIRNFSQNLGDSIVRTANPHRLLDEQHGPLIAIRLNILTRKSLGGLQTNLAGQVMGANGEPVPGLWAAGEVAGFGGGGVHGQGSLEGTFLGGCIFSGREAGRAIGRA